MDSILDYARYICVHYRYEYHQNIDEMKLHKLLYFLQKESLSLMNRLAYKETMHAWVHGPVSLEVREQFHHLDQDNYRLSTENKLLVQHILHKYGALSSSKLSALSHQEKPWIEARRGLQTYEIGTKEIEFKDDFSQPIFDEAWGCFIDEFDDW